MTPAAPAPPAAAEDAPKLPTRGIQPLRSWKAHKFLGLAVAVVVIAVLGPPIVWLKGKHFYTAEGVILISPRFAKNLEQDQELELQSNQQYREFVQQQVKTINRYDIVYDAIERLGDKKNLWVHKNEPDRIVAERLQGALDIKPVADTYQITVGIEETKPEGLAEIVNAVIDTYLSRFKDEELFGTKSRVENLRKDRLSILAEIEAKSECRSDVAQELAVTTFTESNPNPYDQLLVKSKEALAGVRRQRFDAEAQLGAVDRSLRTEGGAALQSLAQDLAARDGGLVSLKANLNQRRADLLTKGSGLSAKHPGRQSIEQELNENDAEIERINSKLVESFSGMLIEQRKAEVYKARRIESDLEGEVLAQTREANGYAAAYQRALECGKDLDRLRKRLNAIEDRLDFLGLETSAPGFARVFARARTPMVPSRAGHKKLAIMVIVAGLALGLIAPIAVDFLDPRVHDPNELQNLLGFTPMGWLPERTAGAESLYADQQTRLANSLVREHRGKGSRIFLLTSVKPGGGTSTIALDTAVELRRLGIDALVVEANSLKPDGRYRSRGWTLDDALAGNQTIDSALLEADERLPARIGPAPLLDAGARLPHIGRLAEALRAVRDYPIILIDTAPLTLSADTEYLVGMADAALVVVEAESVSKAEIKRTARLLEGLSPPAVGSILNRVPVWESGGYYRERIAERGSGKKARATRLATPWLWS